jgi:hypothetical protein
MSQTEFPFARGRPAKTPIDICRCRHYANGHASPYAGAKCLIPGCPCQGLAIEYYWPGGTVGWRPPVSEIEKWKRRFQGERRIRRIRASIA